MVSLIPFLLLCRACAYCLQAVYVEWCLGFNQVQSSFALLSVPGLLVSTFESHWVCFLAKKKFSFVWLDR
ncbi:unnamed protein product [Arabidopsis halleri]